MNSNEIILETKEIVKNYGTQTILNGIDLKVHRGERIAILGASGCGKSTYLKCLNGLESTQGGSIHFQNEIIDSRSQNIHKIRQKIGMVFQNYELFPHLSVLENLTIGPIKVQKRPRLEAQEKAKLLLERFGLAHKENAYPRELSGGQKQRVAIIRSLCMDPEIMLFDEVTASLDPEMVQEVLNALSELAEQGMTMLIVTHELNFARSIADRIILMHEGKIVESSKPEDFFNTPKSDVTRQFLKSYHKNAALYAQTS